MTRYKVIASNTLKGANEIVGRKILVADDNPDAACALAMLLEIDGHEVQTAADGLEAVQRAIDFKPEVILMDIGMPKLDGLEASRRIRALPNGRDVRIIALTGWSRDAQKDRAGDAGIDRYVVKPIDPGALKSILEET